MKKIVLISVCFVFFLSCRNDDQRKIKLAEGTENGLARRKVATIEVAAARKRSIAVLHFVNDTGNHSLDWLRNGIIEMLGTDLAQTRQFYLIPSSLTVPVLQQSGWVEGNTPASGGDQQIALQLRAYAYLTGRYYQNRDTLFIETELRRSEDGLLLGRQSASGPRLDNVFTMVDQLTRKLKGDLQQSLRQNGSGEEGKQSQPTESMEAYRAYLEGQALSDKFYTNQAQPFFEKALALDSTFAAVYFPLANIYLQQNKPGLARQLIQKGLRHADKAGLRDRLNLLALQASMNQNISQALAYYQQVCDLYPESAAGFFIFGNFYFNMARYREAVDRLEAAVQLDPNHKMAYNMLGYSYAALFKVDLAKKALKKYAQLAKDEPNPHDSLGDMLLRFGLMDEAIEAYERALIVDPSFFASELNLIRAYLALGNYEKAKKLAAKALIDSNDPIKRMQALVAQAQVHMACNEVPAAMEALQEVLATNPRAGNVLGNLIQIEPVRARRLERLDAWRGQILSSTDQEIANYSNAIFTFVALCLENDYKLSAADSLLVWYDKKNISPFITTINGAFRQILYMAAGYNTFPELYSMNDEEQKQVLANMPSIAWDLYWKYFFRTMLRSGSDPIAMKRVLTAQRDMARSVGNVPMDIQFSNAIALVETLLGNSAMAEEERRTVGMPKEKDWRFSLAFPAKAGFFKAFGPERNPESEDGWSVGFDGIPDGYISLSEIFDNQINFTGYARLTVHSAKPQAALIQFGSSRPYKIWVNNELLLIQYEYNQARLDNGVYFTKLRAGSNQIMIKVNSLYGQAGFYLRLSDKKGYGLADISYGELNIF